VAIRRAAKATAGAVIEERTRPPVREVPALPLLVVHGAVWRVLDGEQYLVVQSRLCVVELGRLHGVETTVPVGETGSRRLKSEEAYEAHGVTADRVRWTYGADRIGWDPATRTLDLPGARVCAGTAEYSERCDRLLGYLGGERLRDWLATAPLLDRPTAALQLRGPPGVGKGLLTSAVATWLGGRISYEEATGDHNAGLVYAPLVVLDEGVADSRPDAFRQITGGGELRVVAKYRMGEDLWGCPRVIITSNEHDPLRLGREDLSIDSEHALGQRIVVLEADAAAAELLAEIGGWETTADWTGPEGELVRHLRWLAQNRKVTPGRRFLVEGDAAGWVSTAHLRRGIGADVLTAYRAYLDDQELRERCARAGDPFLHDGAVVGISIGVLQRCWRMLLGSHDKVPSNQALAKALRKLSQQEKPDRRGPQSERGPRRYWVPLQRIEEDDVS
jgi:hypothetical protein